MSFIIGENMDNFLTIYFIFVVIFFIVIIITYNSFVRLRNMVKAAFSTMDVYLKKRWDLVPNLIEVVAAYAKHEKDVFEKIAELRCVKYNQVPSNKKLKINKQMTEEISKIMAIVENYPDLKANNNFLELNKQLVEIEEDIADSRNYYNAVVREYNTKIECFPNNILAILLSFKQEKMFEIPSCQRKSVIVE